MKKHLFLVLALLAPLFFVSLQSIGQVVTDPSNTPGYDAAKSRNASRMLATSKPAATPLLHGGATAGSKLGTALKSAGAGCFIPVDASYTAVPRNDDGSFGPIALPFAFDLYGSSYTQVWINTNGNLTFTEPYSNFSATGFPFNLAMVAPFWGDVDTNNPASGQIYYKLSGTHLIVTWDHVGYYYQHADKTNTFQAIIGTANDPLLGAGQNVSLRYDDMQWTTGDASGGSAGFGGTPATVGINKGNNINYVQVGRFDANTAAYDGPGGANDGVNYLDGQCFGFNVSNALNIPPSASNLPANNTVNVACGQTVTINPQFLAPEVNQTVALGVDLGGLCNANVVINNGATANARISITGSACNVGTHSITLTATDNGTPAATTTTTLNVVVASCCNVQLAAASTAVTCPGGADGALALTVSNAVAPLTFNWSNGTTAKDPKGLAAGTYSVIVTDANGCSATGTFSVVQEDKVAPTVRTRNVALALGAAGTATLTPADVDGGSTDNCTFALSLDRTAFTCANVGPNTVTLTATDAAGHQSSATAVVTVVSSIPAPAIAVVRSSGAYTGGGANTLYLGYGAQSATLTASGGASYVWSPATGLSNPNIANPVFRATAAGTYTYTVTATNQYGCTASASVTLRVVDARCGNKNDKVLVCHNGHEICISPNAVDTHLTGHGDQLGTCAVAVGTAARASAPAVVDDRTASELSAYPNPTADLTTVSFRAGHDGPARVVVYNELGQRVATLFQGEVMSGQVYALPLQSQSLATGLYMCQLVLNGRSEVLRLVIAR